MPKIAIVFGFSESCYELARQVIVSAHLAAKLSKIEATYHFFAYECNYNLASGCSTSFVRQLDLKEDLPIEGLNLTQLASANFKWIGVLPDISIYHHFTTTHLDLYDYTLFCHNDIYFKKHPTFRDLVNSINKTKNIVAEPAVACLRNISLRFRPSFIFVRTDKFREANLSFINNYTIFHEDMNSYPIEGDGGAGLLASYYANNSTNAMPFSTFPSTWFKHLRLETDYGVEMYNLFNPNGPQFNSIIKRAKQYADHHVYGQHSTCE